MSELSRNHHSRNPGFNWSVRDELDDGYPTKKLLLAKQRPNLTENKLFGSYQSVSEYVDIHFDLLLEDYVHPLRGALSQFKRGKKSRSLDGVRVHHDVRLHSLKFGAEVTCMMDIEQLKEPSFGSLVVFTKENFNKCFFLGMVISDTSKTGVSAVEFKLKFPVGSRVSLKNLCNQHFIMIEGEAFFYAYFHVLKALNLLHEGNFPLKQYIVYGNKKTNVKHPAYLSRSTTYRISDFDVPVLNDSTWPSSKDLKMNNESQYNALKKALTEEIALIQGPPGTGKTYFGVSLVKVLLENDTVWNPSGSTPLLIVCQSNEALDHFLEKLLPYTGKLVRVGEQSHNSKLKPLFLKELVCRHVNTQYRVPGLNSLLESLDKTREQVKHLTQGIVSFVTLEQYGIITEETAKVIKSEETYLKWLGLHVKAEQKCCKAESGIDLIVSMEELLKHIYHLELSGEYFLAILLEDDLAVVSNFTECFKESFREEVEWNDSNLLFLSPHDAQNVYLSWLDKFYCQLEEEVEVLEDQFEYFWSLLHGFQKNLAIMHVLRSAKVVGLTSTGAASRNLILRDLKAPIVILEEAGEILESHVVVSMTEHCQHLIMMGDHKQLKPSVTTHHLAENFNLNVSMFERLLTNEVVTSTALTTQYRMRPEISALLKPHIYSALIDGPGTTKRPPVRGIMKSVFFVHHEVEEEKARDNKGYWNSFEVGFLINLAKYLVCEMAYAPEDITIISMYTEQKNQLMEARDRIPALSNLLVASVDGYQGKENEIVLLSLVRSNKNGRIGFLREENRVCVALSRARTGLYIVGNMRCLTKGGKMWTYIRERLLEQDAIGTKLILSCDRHKTVRYVAEDEEWSTYCHSCQVDQTSTTKKDVQPAKSNRTWGDLSRCNPKTTLCTCCQSFYCDCVVSLLTAFENLTLNDPVQPSSRD